MSSTLGGIFSLSAVPDLSSGLKYDFPLRKLAHITEYAVLFWLCRRAFRGTWNVPAGAASKAADIAAAAFSVLYAMSDEYHQSFVRGRSGAWMDVAVDSAGVALAALAVRLLPRRLFRQRRTPPVGPMGPLS